MSAVAPKVAVLPPELASQIAAGEVAERPASVVKELVENSLDAEATRLDVEIEGGGILRICVTDDGFGMSEADARLALERHATSKLRSLDDLMNVRSYGFRGEALPSIASVSRFRLCTRERDAELGIELFVEAGATPVARQIGARAGTRIEIADLFFNVPARRKFLRSSATESGHVADVIENAALARPDVTFTLSRDGRRVRELLRVTTRAERVAQVLDTRDLARCEGERGPLAVEAYLSRPEAARAGGAGLHLFVNGRNVRDRALLATIAHAYGSVLEKGRYPRGVVYLDIAPELVDVNVHPQKSEVRFADPRAVSDVVYALVSRNLASAFSLPPQATHHRSLSERPLPGASPDREALRSSTPQSPSPEPERNTEPGWGAARSSPPVFPLRTSEPASAARTVFTVSEPLHPLHDAAAPLRDAAEPLRDAAAMQLKTAELAPLEASSPDPSAPQVASISVGSTPSSRPASTSVALPPARPEPPEAESKWQNLRFVAQLRNTYLLCEGSAGIYLLDQHAAAERVTFSRLRRQYAAREVGAQTLLFPVLVELTPPEAEVVEARASELAEVGLDVRMRGSSSASLHSVPKLLARAHPERLLRDLLLEVTRAGERAFSDAVDLALATLACHGSARAGDELGPAEVRALLLGLDEADFAGHCPHGRPIVTFTAWAELERKVGRR
ncbi:MAG TPA: DNA mismatch repair endonuclease MutL [Polyangiaceae bacterium]|nr:DNA mismatch repair endonuclease MutL [Polyangiaceae bacterium]